MSNKYLQSVKVVILFKKQLFYPHLIHFTLFIQIKASNPQWIARSMEVN